MLPSMSNSQNIFQIIQNRETHSYKANLENYLNNRLIKNLKNENYSEWKCLKEDFPCDNDNALQYDPKTNLLITSNESRSSFTGNFIRSLKGWFVNSNLKKYAWTYEFDKSYLLNIKKIVNEILIISNSIKGDDGIFYNSIYLLNLYTGKKISEINDSSKSIESCINIKEKKIFTYSRDLVIKEWNFDGSLNRIIDFYKSPIKPYAFSNKYNHAYFLSKNNFLIRIYTESENNLENPKLIIKHFNVLVNNLKNLEQKSIQVSYSLSKVYIHAQYLFCGWENHNEPSDFGIIDINSGNIIFKTKVFKNYIPNSLIPNAIETIFFRQDLAFLAHYNGEMKVFDLTSNVFKLIGKQNGYVTRLFLKGKILVSTDIHLKNSKIKFWDIESLKEITEIQTFALKNFSFTNGKLYSIQDSSLMIRDYLSNDDNDSMIIEEEDKDSMSF